MFRILNAEGDTIHTISVLLRDILYERYLIETPSGMVNAIYYQFSLEIYDLVGLGSSRAYFATL
jgi:hypothetical protein